MWDFKKLKQKYTAYSIFTDFPSVNILVEILKRTK